jgi:dTDP-4-dehydrorhamnose reductase
VPINDYHLMEAFVRETEPDALFHLAIASRLTGVENEEWAVNYEWPSELAWICRLRDVPFIFTSTVMVFSTHHQGPFTRESIPDATDGYGGIKRRAENRVFYQNPDARVVRLGWQIGDAPGSNNMIDFLDQRVREGGAVQASVKWLPACSFLEDTVAALRSLPSRSAGLYQIDSNSRWTFHQIATALNALHGEPWKIDSTEDFVYDQRMLDPDLKVPCLQRRLAGLP